MGRDERVSSGASVEYAAGEAQIALDSAKKISRERLLDGLRALREADDRLKGGAGDKRFVMEMLVWELSGGGAARAQRG